MNVGESFRISWRSITSHKLRSTLTTIGVIIGIASVITFMILGGGFADDVIGDLNDENEPSMIVQTQTSPPDGVGFMLVDSPIYTETDVEALEAIDDIEYVAPQGDLSVVQVRHDGETRTGGITVQATSPEPAEHRQLEGETFSAEDEAVINTQAAQLFEGNVSVGEEISITEDGGTTTTFTVTGIVDDDVGGQTAAPAVYVPLDPHYTLEIETPRGTTEAAYPSLEVRAQSLDDVDPVQEAVIEYFETDADARELKSEDDRIEVQTLEDAIEQFTDIVDQLTIFIGGIAAISLVVGSIGIANIMIVSVTERTREIGIMKAVGARRRDIMQLFLVESIILGIIGAFFGVLAGLGFGYLAVTLIGWPMAYPIDWIVIAVVVGVGVGIVSGLYPAWRGARVDPIDALRHE